MRSGKERMGVGRENSTLQEDCCGTDTNSAEPEFIHVTLVRLHFRNLLNASFGLLPQPHQAPLKNTADSLQLRTLPTFSRAVVGLEISPP
jgi:hypothetical protein